VSTVNAFLGGAIALIALYLLLSRETPSVIESIARGAAQVFKTLQGRG